MKLFEDMKEMGGTIHDAIQKMVNEMFREELDDDQIDEIVNRLSLSDLLELDSAYTDGDKERVQDILGPLPQLEYSMGTNRHPTSNAANRPAPRAAQGQQPQKKPGTQNTVNTNRNYNAGAQNAVTTQNVDNEDPDAMVQDEEPVEEGVDDNHYKKFFARVAREMGKLLGAKGRLKNYRDTEVKRIITMQIGDREVEVYQTWAADGSKNKPVTYVDLGDYGEVKLGRFSIEWRKPQNYASDLVRSINKYMDERDYDADWDAEADAANANLMYKDESVEGLSEANSGSFNDEQFNSHEVIRALEGIASDEEDEDPQMAAGLQMLANRINQSYPDSVRIDQIMDMLNEPQLRSLRKDDVTYALQAAGIMDFMETSVNESIPNAFHIGDEVIDDQGRTGVISGKPFMNHIHVNFYNGGEEAVKMSNLQLNDYADSDEEEHDLRRSMGDDEYDRMHGDLGYKDESINEETNIVDMVKWLKRRAGIE